MHIIKLTEMKLLHQALTACSELSHLAKLTIEPAGFRIHSIETGATAEIIVQIPLMFTPNPAVEAMFGDFDIVPSELAALLSEHKTTAVGLFVDKTGAFGIYDSVKRINRKLAVATTDAFKAYSPKQVLPEDFVSFCLPSVEFTNDMSNLCIAAGAAWFTCKNSTLKIRAKSGTTEIVVVKALKVDPALADLPTVRITIKFVKLCFPAMIRSALVTVHWAKNGEFIVVENQSIRCVLQNIDTIL